MSITFKTQSLMDAVSQLNRLAPSKLLEITRYWHIEGYAGQVTFTGYDGSNWLRFTLEADGDIDVMVKADQFGKLIEKTTVEKVTLSPKSEYLEVKANGTYKVDIVTGDESYPSFDDKLPEDLDEDSAKLLKTSLFYQVYNINDSAVSKSNADGIYTGYLLDDDKAVTSDIIRVCLNPIESIGTRLLIPSPLMKLLASLTEDKLYLWNLDDEYIYVSTSTVEIYGRLMEGIEDYQDMSVMDEQEFEGSVKLATATIQAILERLTLFMSPFDKGTIRLDFGPKQLAIITTSGSKEAVKYAEVTSTADFSCALNSILLRDILATVNEEYFTLEFGNDLSIRITANGVTYYLATQEEGEEA